jgi:hypothetical protein
MAFDELNVSLPLRINPVKRFNYMIDQVIQAMPMVAVLEDGNNQFFLE